MSDAQNASLGQAEPALAGPAGAQSWPWEPDQGVAARLAIASLQKFFLRSLAKDGRLQLETLFCAVGALAGFAAQHAVRQDCLRRGGAKTDDLLAAESKSGERFFFGERLNAILVPHRAGDLTVWSVIAGEAMRLGATAQDLPDGAEIFDHVTTSIGTPEFGVPRAPAGHKPWLAPRRAVEIFWPSVLTVFTREPVVAVTDFRLVEARHWPLALALVGAGYMPFAKAPFTPALAVALFMESAVAMSKIDPATVRFAGSATH